MAQRFNYTADTPGVIYIDDGGGTYRPFQVGAIAPVFDTGAATLSVRYSHNDRGNITQPATYGNIQCNLEGADTGVASFAQLITYVANFFFANAVGGGGGGGGDATAANQETEINLLGAILAGPLEVVGNTYESINTPVISSGINYAPGACIGGVQAFNALRISNSAGTLASLLVMNKSGQTPPLDILIFNANPTGGSYTNHAVPTYNATDMGKLIRKVSIATTDWTVYGAYAVADIATIAKTITGNNGDNYIYMVVINTTATPTFGSTSDITFRLGLYRD